MENAESNGIPFRAYWWLVLIYLAFFVGLFAFYDQSYRTALISAVILGYSLHAFFYEKRLRINEDGEKYVVLEKAETGTCLQCPNCGEFYTWFRPHGAYCRGCGYKIVSPIDWIIKE